MTIGLESYGIEVMEAIQAGFDHELREDPMSEAYRDALRLDSDRT